MAAFLINAVKFVLAVILSPIVIATIVGFLNHLQVYPSTYEDFFLWGAGMFLLLYLFIHQFWGVYEFGQKVISSVLKVISPLDRLIVNILPFYHLIILLAFYLAKGFLKIQTYDPYFVFFAGFSLAMHIILAAQEMQNQEKSVVKSTYLLHMCFVFVIVISLCVVFLDLIVGKWTFSDYFTSVSALAWDYYSSIINHMAAP